MKKCPRCLKTDDDDVRFCKHCNTELFFVERFPASTTKNPTQGISDALVFILNGTWGAVQSLIGSVIFLLYAGKPHYRYKGCVVTTNAKSRLMPRRYGVSLGVFVFTSEDITKDRAQDDKLINHEYGHCLQSILLGPLFMVIIGIPSMTWMLLFENWRRRHNKSYYSLCIEAWADRLGGVKRSDGAG